jgi:PAS domain S-box-containing protein
LAKDTPLTPSCEQLIDMLPHPFVVIDQQYRIVAANRQYCDRYGGSPAQIVGRKCHEVSHHSDVPCSQHGEHCPLEAVFRTNEPVQVIHVHYDGHGKQERVQLSASPIRDADGNILYMGEYVQDVLPLATEHAPLIGRSPVLLQLISVLQRVAPTQTTVLLLGESGCGKEQVAKYLHHYSQRVDQPFVVVDCGALGETLIESELFGHEKGAFTGANQRKTGLFEAADGGTLFIDEIGDLPMGLQTKLLRALETGTIRRIGGTEYIKVDVRVLAATHRDLHQCIREGSFREDLYYRLSAFPIEVPPLRARKDDIPTLASHFLGELDHADYHLPISAEVIAKLLSYDYPGNVRELKNIVERAAILACNGPILPSHIVFEGSHADRPGAEPILLDRAPADGLVRRRQRHSDAEILAALQQAGGHRQQAAQALGISERSLYRRLAGLRQGQPAD